MTQENSTRIRFWYDQDEGYDSRCQRRLLNDLGVDEVAVETILRLRSQVIELQAQIRRLEASLEERTAHMLQTTHQLKAPFAAIHVPMAM